MSVEQSQEPRLQKPQFPVVAIVVTFNRKQWLRECIDSLLSQTSPCDLLIIDNASTDGTFETLREDGILGHRRVNYVRRSENSGGAGGFAAGVEAALANGWEWFWLMDDDALPDPVALEKLIGHATDTNSAYGSAAVARGDGAQRLCSPASASYDRRAHRQVEYLRDLDRVESVTWIIFVGFFIHREMVEKIGFPLAELFIYWDDLEYSERVKRHGGKLLLIKESLIFHPVPKTATIRVLNLKAQYRSLSPWKLYYEVRNKIYIMKTYHRELLWLQTLPGILFRFLIGMIVEKDRVACVRSYARAMTDGFRGRLGRRVSPP